MPKSRCQIKSQTPNRLGTWGLGIGIPRRRGFTLVEAAVIMALIVIVASIVLANLPILKQRVLFQRASRELASALRQMQNRALAVDRIAVGNSFETPRRVGISFDTRRSASSFSYFADRNDNGSYDGSYTSDACSDTDPLSNSDCIFQTGTLPAGVTIADICFNIDGGSGGCSQTRLDVTFKSPAASMDLGSGRVSAKIILVSSSLAYRRSVKVYTSGQIGSQAE